MSRLNSFNTCTRVIKTSISIHGCCLYGSIPGHTAAAAAGDIVTASSRHQILGSQGGIQLQQPANIINIKLNEWARHVPHEI